MKSEHNYTDMQTALDVLKRSSLPKGPWYVLISSDSNEEVKVEVGNVQLPDCKKNTGLSKISFASLFDLSW